MQAGRVKPLDEAASSSLDHWGLSFEQVVLLVHSCPESCSDVTPACASAARAAVGPPAPPSVPALSPPPPSTLALTCYVSMADSFVPHSTTIAAAELLTTAATASATTAARVQSTLVPLGGDCTDCGPGGGTELLQCSFVRAGRLCGDGGPGAHYAVCTFGTDCDCGDRAAGQLPPWPPPWPPSKCHRRPPSTLALTRAMSPWPTV